MTLGEMADYVCTKVRRTDAAAVKRAKSFLARRYEMIAQEELWKDLIYRLEFTFALGEFEVVTSPNRQSRSAGIWHLPSAVDKVLAVRSASLALSVDDPFQMLRSSLDEFAETGDPLKFHVEGAVVADFRGSLDDAAGGISFFGSAGDAGTLVQCRYLDLSGEMQKFAGALGDSGPSGRFSPSVIVTASKPATVGAVTVEVTATGYSAGTCAADAVAFPRYSRLRLVPIPTQNVALKALVKLKAEVMTDDNDEPQINGIENCLMAFAQADALQHARQYGKAQLVTGEAMALLMQLKRVAVAQEASLQRIVPMVAEVAGEWDSGVGGKGSW